MRPWLGERVPDVLCLQEVHATDADLAAALGEGWYLRKAGFLPRSEHPPVVVRYDVGDDLAGGILGAGLDGG